MQFQSALKTAGHVNSHFKFFSPGFLKISYDFSSTFAKALKKLCQAVYCHQGGCLKAMCTRRTSPFMKHH